MIDTTLPYFYYDPNYNEYHYFATKEERDKDVYDLISDYTEIYDDSLLTDIFAGEITHCVKMFNKTIRPTNLDEEGYDDNGEYWDNECSYKCDIELVPILED